MTLRAIALLDRLGAYAIGLAAALLSIAPGYADTLSLGLPPLPIPADNPLTPAKIALGRAVFMDKRLSADGTISCATCHDPQRAFADGLPVARGQRDASGARNTPTLLNAAYGGAQFWDGRRASLEEQANDPFFNAAEHGFGDHESLLNVIRNDAWYVAAFQQAFEISSAAISMDHVAKAIASFERTLIAGDSPFDRYRYGGDRKALSEQAISGLALFTGRARCQTCHRIGAQSALFTDRAFHRLGVGHKRVESRLADIALQAAKTKRQDIGAAMLDTPELSELGRFMVTLRPADIGRFKTPSLRNVALTAPYMHDGSVKTLEQTVDLELYYRGVEANRPLILTPRERADLVEFLKSLTSPQFSAAMAEQR